MDTAAPKTSKLRPWFILGAGATFAVWIAAWYPAIVTWNEPGISGFVAIPGVLATFTLLPLGTFALWNAIDGRPGQIRNAGVALFVVLGLIAAVAGIEVQGNIIEAQYAAAN